MDHKTIGNRCEVCGDIVGSTNLYVDIVNNIYALECQKCFYSQYNSNVKKYYEKVKGIIPDVLSEAKFDRVKKGCIVIADAFPLLKGAAISKQNKENFSKDAVKNLIESPKMLRKFSPVEVKIKTAEDIGTFIVAVTAKVRFRSYLEFLEHELYLRFRKETESKFS